jgi:hypothetical protein
MGNYTWSGIKDWEEGELVYTSDMNGYVSNNIGLIYEEFPPNFFGADKAIFPSSNAASTNQFESTGSTNIAPNWSELVFSGSADNAAQWNFRSWFRSTDMTGFRFRAYTTDATAATDDVDIVVSIAAISGGDSDINTKAFATLGTVTIDTDLEATAHTLKTYSVPASAWDGISVADIGIVELKRLGSVDNLPLDLRITRGWFY